MRISTRSASVGSTVWRMCGRIARRSACRVRFKTDEVMHLQPLAARVYHPLVLPVERTARGTSQSPRCKTFGGVSHALTSCSETTAARSVSPQNSRGRDPMNTDLDSPTSAGEATEVASAAHRFALGMARRHQHVLATACPNADIRLSQGTEFHLNIIVEEGAAPWMDGSEIWNQGLDCMSIQHSEHPPLASGDRERTSHRGSMIETGRSSGVTGFREMGDVV